MVVHEGTTDFNGFVDGSELACAVTSYDNRIGIVVFASSKSSEE